MKQKPRRSPWQNENYWVFDRGGKKNLKSTRRSWDLCKCYCWGWTGWYKIEDCENKQINVLLRNAILRKQVFFLFLVVFQVELFFLPHQEKHLLFVTENCSLLLCFPLIFHECWIITRLYLTHNFKLSQDQRGELLVKLHIYRVMHWLESLVSFLLTVELEFQ